MERIKNLAIVFAVAALMATVWNFFKEVPPPIDKWTPAQQASQVRDVPKVDITPAKVKVYAPKAKDKLDLPPAITNDPDVHVLDTTRVSSDDHPSTITTVIDAKTGEVQTLVRREPLPWLAAEQRGELRFDVGIKNGLNTIGRLTVREDLLQVKALHAGLHASLDSDGRWFAGGGVGYRW